MVMMMIVMKRRILVAATPGQRRTLRWINIGVIGVKSLIPRGPGSGFWNP